LSYTTFHFSGGDSARHWRGEQARGEKKEKREEKRKGMIK